MAIWIVRFLLNSNYVSLPFFEKCLANVFSNQIRFLKIMYPWLRMQATPKRRLENPSLTIGICWIYVSSSSLLLLNICTLFLVYVLCYMYKHRIEVTLILFLRKKMLLKSSFLQSDYISQSSAWEYFWKWYIQWEKYNFWPVTPECFSKGPRIAPRCVCAFGYHLNLQHFFLKVA